MTDKHAGEENLEDSAERIESDITAEARTESDDAHTVVDEASADEEIDEAGADEEIEAVKPAESERRIDWSRVLAFAILPALAFVLVMGAGALKFMDSAVRESDIARDQSVQAAKDNTVALLTYKPDTVEQQLTAARDRLTGDFRNEYSELINNVVIPGAKEKQISAVASVPGAASVSADPGRAVVLLFVNQTVTVGDGAPADTASSVRVTLDKVDDRWLISEFEPV